VASDGLLTGVLVSPCLYRALNSECSRQLLIVMSLSWTMPRVTTVVAMFDSHMLTGTY
jgi:hypothetical protein